MLRYRLDTAVTSLASRLDEAPHDRGGDRLVETQSQHGVCRSGTARVDASSTAMTGICSCGPQDGVGGASTTGAGYSDIM